MSRLPPRSTLSCTLFPSTTLFLSCWASRRLGDGHAFIGGTQAGPGCGQARVGAIGIDERLPQGFAMSRAGGDQGKCDETPFQEAPAHRPSPLRSVARRVGQACVSTCRSRGAPYHENNKTTKTTSL